LVFRAIRKGGLAVQMLNRAEPLLDLESVIKTSELIRRPSRLPDFEAENRALVGLGVCPSIPV
jgi:hypothetical protein